MPYFGAVSRAFAHKSNLIVFVVTFGVFSRCCYPVTKATLCHFELSYHALTTAFSVLLKTKTVPAASPVFRFSAQSNSTQFKISWALNISARTRPS